MILVHGWMFLGIVGVQLQVYDCIEVFSGIASLSKCLSLAGFATASLDVTYWEPFMKERRKKRLKKVSRGNALDLLTPAGYSWLGLQL